MIWQSRTRTAFPIVLALVLMSAPPLKAQGSAGTGARYEPRFIVDMPTAGMLAKGTYAIDARFYGNGGLLVGFSAGIFSRLLVGISYGGSGIVGGGDPVMNVAPGFSAKVRIIEEGVVAPAVALGFDSQGYGGYIKELSRYVIKSPGFYGALSKNYNLLGYLSVHGGVNYSLERADGDSDVNFYAGAEKSLGPFAALLVEYNLGMNDSNQGASGKGRGYLNAALHISPAGGLTVGFCVKDILKNGRTEGGVTRTIKIEFVTPF
jgi:hypothetical protein